MDANAHYERRKVMNENFRAFADRLVKGAVVAASTRLMGKQCTSFSSPIQLTFSTVSTQTGLLPGLPDIKSGARNINLNSF